LLAPLGWVAAGPTLTPVKGDTLNNICATRAIAESAATHHAELTGMKKQIQKYERLKAVSSSANYICLTPQTEERLKYQRLMFTVQAREEHLDKLVKMFWLDQTMPGDDELATPIQDDILMDKISISLKQLPSGKLQLPCLWKTKQPNIPNNYTMCKNRLISLLSYKLITTTTQLLGDYHAIFQKWEDKGYIEQVLDPYRGRQGVWYAPHFPVLRMQKETTKIRPVFDCAAETKGVCENDFLTQGPQVMNELGSVMHYFRRYDIAMTGDIAEMFLQVQVAEEDKDY
jgi:hypothetical protein